MAKRLTNKVAIIGCGPGSLGYITLKALQCIKESDILVGSKRLLSLFPEVKANKILLGKNYRTLLSKITSLSSRKKVTILVSGDPGFFSYARLVVGRLGQKNCEVIPGISCMQLAFAAIGKTWNDAHFMSLHGRRSELEGLVEVVKTHNKVAVLNDGGISPRLLSHTLIKGGVKDRKIFLCENLSLENEKVREYDLDSLGKVEAGGMNVLIFTTQGVSSSE